LLSSTETNNNPGNFDVTYAYNDSQILFTIMGYNPGWIGMSIQIPPNDDGMTNADYWILRYNGSTLLYEDRWSSTFSTPSLDTSLGGTNNVKYI